MNTFTGQPGSPSAQPGFFQPAAVPAAVLSDGVQVLLDDGTGTFPYDITAKCLLGNGWSISRGRGDWDDAPTAGELTDLTLNNSDGRFTPGSTIIGSPSPIKVDQRIRVKETVNGATYTRFTGYVKGWPVAWPATVPTFSTVQVTATDAQARAERRILRSVIEEEILADTPVGYFTLSEPAGSTSVADTSGQYWAGTLSPAGSGTAVVFGNGIGSPYDGLTAATFAAGKYLSGSLLNNTLSTLAFEAVIVTSADGLIARAVTPPDTSGVVTTLELRVSGGKAVLQRTSDGTGDFTLTSTTTVTDGLLHHIGAGPSAGLWLTVDGSTEATAGTYGTTSFQPSATLYIGGAPGATGFTGTIGHVAVLNQLISLTRVQAHSSAVRTGFAGESGTTRMTRLAGYANIPIGTLDTSLTNVPFIEISGRSAQDCIQEVADAEMGVAFVDETGSLDFHNRNRPPAKTTPDLSITSDYLTGDPTPTQDDQQILNYVEATAIGTGVAQVARSVASETSHGRYSDSKTYLVQTDAEVLDRANWIVANFAEPTTRYGTLTINLFRLTAAQAQVVIAAVDVDTWLRITAMPTQTTGGTTADVVVEGFAEHRDGSSWTLTLNVVSRSLFNAGIYDDTTYGVFDSAVSRFYV